MQVATWNVNSIRTRQEIVIDWLKNHPIDILCLQETKVRDEQFPLTFFEQLGYHTYISGQKAYNGVAIFSRNKLQDVSFGFSPIIGAQRVGDFDLQKRVITGICDGVRIVNLYVPNGATVGGDKYEYKLAWLELLKEYLQLLISEDSRGLCVCGDFNIALEDRDIYDSKDKEQHIMSSPKERAALREILDLGFQDAFRKFTGEEGHFSWWNYRAGGFRRNRGWRIDHTYLTSTLYEHALNCWIDIEPRKLEKPSDHAPVIVEF